VDRQRVRSRKGDAQIVCNHRPAFPVAAGIHFVTLSQLRRFHPLATPSILSAVSILRRILAAYAHYYSDARTHLALNKNTPAERVVQRAGSAQLRVSAQIREYPALCYAVCGNFRRAKESLFPGKSPCRSRKFDPVGFAL
jgi:hypothetical protein